MALADPWSILGLRPGAGRAAVRAAYRRAAWQHHPDHGGSASRMAAINRAYAELTARSRRTDASPTDRGAETSSPRPRPGPSRPEGSGATRAASPMSRQGSDRASALWSSRLGQWAVTLAGLGAVDLLWRLAGVHALALAAAVLAMVVIADRRPSDAPYWPVGDVLTVLVTLVAWLLACARDPRPGPGEHGPGASLSGRR